MRMPGIQVRFPQDMLDQLKAISEARGGITYGNGITQLIRCAVGDWIAKQPETRSGHDRQ